MVNTRFTFRTSQEIVFGNGSAASAFERARVYGRRIMAVTGARQRHLENLVAIAPGDIELHVETVDREPTVPIILQLAENARMFSPDAVISIGGGSVLDASKAAAALAANPGELHDYLEVVGKGEPLRHPPLPHMALPTTAGTGTEVTKNAVISVPEQRIKVSMRDDRMIPTCAIVDPELTQSVPPPQTAASGLDALTQLVEAYTSVRAQPLTDALCREGILRAGRSLLLAVQHGDDIAAREDMCMASLFSGLALANAGLGAVHGFAGPMGGLFHAPHGALCAVLLPHVFRVNASAVDDLSRFNDIAQLLTGRDGAGVDDALEWMSRLYARLQLPSLTTLGVTEQDIPLIVEKAQHSSSMKGNPATLSEEQLAEILRAALS